MASSTLFPDPDPANPPIETPKRSRKRSSKEIDVEAFKFECHCPRCGFPISKTKT